MEEAQSHKFILLVRNNIGIADNILVQDRISDRWYFDVCVLKQNC